MATVTLYGSFDNDPMLEPTPFGLPENVPGENREQISEEPEVQAESSPPATKPTLCEATYGNVGDANIFKDVFGDDFDTAKLNAFCGKVIAASGWTGNSLELILIEEICLAHFTYAATLHRANTAPDAEAFELYSAAAMRTMTEIRRSVVSLRELQQPHFRAGKKKTKEKA